MTKTNFTSINIVLDRSGSMKTLAADTIGGFNTFIAEQKKVEGEAALTLATFASDYKLIHDFTPLKHIADLTLETYQPAGYTALYDAIGRTINATGNKLAAMKEEDRPSQVLFVIMTDGENNASKEFTREQVFSMLEHQRSKYNWQVVYIGAGADAMKTGVSLGVSAANAVQYDSKSAAGSLRAFNSISANTTSYRRSKTSGEIGFFDQGNIKPLEPVIVGPNGIDPLDTPTKK